MISASQCQPVPAIRDSKAYLCPQLGQNRYVTHWPNWVFGPNTRCVQPKYPFVFGEPKIRNFRIHPTPVVLHYKAKSTVYIFL